MLRKSSMSGSTQCKIPLSFKKLATTIKDLLNFVYVELCTSVV